MESFQSQRNSDINGLYVSFFSLKSKILSLTIGEKVVICSTKTSLTLNFYTTQCYAYWKYITIRKPSCVVTAKFIFPYYKRKMKPNFKSFGSYNFLPELSTKDLWRYTSEGYSCNGLKWIYYIINDDCSFNIKYDNATDNSQ